MGILQGQRWRINYITPRIWIWVRVQGKGCRYGDWDGIHSPLPFLSAFEHGEFYFLFKRIHQCFPFYLVEGAFYFLVCPPLCNLLTIFQVEDRANFWFPINCVRPFKTFFLFGIIYIIIYPKKKKKISQITGFSFLPTNPMAKSLSLQLFCIQRNR